jgi:crossover junction endodeoxyribonuclease RusA
MERTEVSFFVTGKPAPQGSKKSIGNNRFIEASKYLPNWRAAVVSAAQQSYDGEPLDVPVRVRIIVFINEPKKPKYKLAPATPPDVDKVARGILDALKIGGIYRDDALVVSLEIDKMWSVEGMQGAFVSIVTI